MRRFLLIVCAVLGSVSLVSAQEKIVNFFKSYDWTPHYKGEVNVGFAVTGSKVGFDYMEEFTSSRGGNESYEIESPIKMNTVLSRSLIETVHGVQFDKYLFVGAGIGLHYYCGKLNDCQHYADIAATVDGKETPSERWHAVMLPIFANVKFMYPVTDNLVPFLNLSLGGTVGLSSAVNYESKINDYGYTGTEQVRLGGGFYCDFGVGVRWKCWSLGLGLQHQGLNLVGKCEEQVNEFGVNYSYKEKTEYRIDSNAFYVKVGFCF